MPAFLLQARDRRDDSAVIRVGFTASKKVGNAVTRNRAKRRLRALARTVLAGQGQPGWDYVLVARAGETVSRNFADMERDLARANEAAAAAPAAGNGSGTLPDGFGQHLSSLQDSIDSLRANMRAASDETAVMDQTDSVQVITSALTQATEEIERARDALRALDEIVAP